MGKNVYSGGAKISPNTDFDSVNLGGKSLKSVLEGKHDSVVEEFDVQVSYENKVNDEQLSGSVTSHKTYTAYNHHCFFSAVGGDKKSKLIISFPGGGMAAKNWYSYMNTGKVFNALGYAVLCITGYSSEYMASKGVTSNAAPVGSWYATEEVIKAYNYIIDKYDWIDKSGCYFYAESQGGNIAENVADFGGIPIKAVALDAPAVSIQHVQMSLRMASVTAIYGITSGNFDKNKCLGCDPYTRGVSEEIGTNPSNVTAKKHRNTNSPLLIIGGTNDQLVSPSVVKCYAKAVMNDGGWVEYRGYSNLTSPYHGVVEKSPVCGKIGISDVTEGLVDVLNFFERNGGYKFTLV